MILQMRTRIYCIHGEYSVAGTRLYADEALLGCWGFLASSRALFAQR